MMRKLSCLILFFFLLFIVSPYPVIANQTTHKQPIDTFFSFFENYIIAYNTLASENKHVLAAHTEVQPTQTSPSLTQVPPQPTQTSQQIINPPTDVSAYILHGVNDYRSSLGLSQVQSSKQTCDFAATRASEITNAFNHDGFYNRVNNHTIPYTTWARAVENIAETPDYKNVVTLWKNSPDHAANMRDNTPFVCIMQNGNYYAYEGMRP